MHCIILEVWGIANLVPGWIGSSTRLHHYTPRPHHTTTIDKTESICISRSQSHSYSHRASDVIQSWKRIKREQMPPQQEGHRHAGPAPQQVGHRHAGPFATVKLHQTKTHWRNENTDTEQLTTRGSLATSAVGLPLSRARASPLPPQSSTLQNRFKSCC
jgi:hypothetical protein